MSLCWQRIRGVRSVGAHDRCGGWAETAAELVTALSGIRDLAEDPRLDFTLRPRVHLLALQLAEGLQQRERRIEVAEQALAAAEQWGGWTEVGQVRLEASRVLYEAGADQRAAAVLNLFLEHLDRYPWLGLERGPAQCRLGLVLQRARQYSPALQAYRRALDSLSGDPGQRLAAYHHCVWLAVRLGRHREAARYLAWAAPLAEDSGEGALMQKALQALYFHRTGDRTAAERLAAEAHQAAAAAGMPRPLALATYVLAQNAGVENRSAEAAARRAELRAHLEQYNDAELAAWFGPRAAGAQGAAGDESGAEGSSDAAFWSL